MFPSIFFPSINFNLMAAEVFPYAIICFFFYTVKYNTVSKAFTALLLIVLIFSIVQFFLIPLIPIDQYIRSLASYINAMSAFFVTCIYIKYNGIKKFENLTMVIFKVLLLTAFLQSLNLITFLEPVFDILKSRGGVNMGEGVRGVAIFSTEPSRAAYEMIILYAILRLCYNDRDKNIVFSFDVLFFIFLLFVIKSMTGLALYIIYMSLSYFKLRLFIKITLVACFAFFTMYIFKDVIFQYFQESNNRTLLLLYSLFSNENITSALIKSSGFRIISILSSYYYIFNSIFGEGVGAWQTSSVLALDNFGAQNYQIPYFYYSCGEFICPVRPTSFLANVALDFGFLGFLFVVLIICYLFLSINNKYKSLYLYIVFLLLFSSTVGHPLLWVSLAFVLMKSKFDTNLLSK